MPASALRPETPAPAVRKGGGRHEVWTVIRAGSSSVVATVVDGSVYQLALLGSLEGSRRYMLAAAIGAVAGALTNFLLSRYWTFRATHAPIARQALHYSAAAVVGNLVLQLALVLLVEALSLDPRLAWVPAKVFCWGAVNYPLARFFVFR